MRYSILMVAASALTMGTAHAKNDQVQRGPTPEWVTPSDLMEVPSNAGGAVFVRRQDSLIRLDAQGQRQYLGYRIRILHPNALQLGNLSIAWHPSAGAPVVHAIKVHRDNETIDVLKTATFEIMRREDQLEAARLDGILTAVLRVSDLRVGDELEFSLTTPMHDPNLGKNDAGLLFLAASPPAGRFRMGLSWDRTRQPMLKMTSDLTAIARKAPQSVEFRFDNPALLSPPKDAPPRHQWQRIVEYSDFTDWAAVSRHFAPMYAKAAVLAPASPLKREASRIAAAHADQAGRAAAALKLVQQDVRYIYVGLNGGNLMPATADETWQRRYGDCKGKTALLLALLGEMGIEAEAVIVNSAGGDDGLNERLPNPGMFDHVVVRAKIGDTIRWLDGTLPPVVPPGAVPAMPFRWVLPLSSEGRELEQLPWQPSPRPDEISLYEIDARAGFDKPARITSTTIVRGIKGLQQQIQFSGLAPGQLLAGLRQELVGNTWQSIDDVQWRYDQKAQASVMMITGMGSPGWEDDGDEGKSLALPGGGFSPPEKRLRAADQDQDLPFYNKPEFDCRVTTVRVPSTTRATNWSLKPSYDMRFFGRSYHRALEFRDGIIRMIRGTRVEVQEIDAAVARQDNARLAKFDNSMAWVSYSPDSETAPARGAMNVPTTYDIDWTADNVPCLSAADSPRDMSP